MTEKSQYRDSTYRSDIELILIGVALAKSPDRQRVLDAFKKGSFEKSRDDVIDAIRKEERDPVVRFVESRGARVEKGKDIVQALIDLVYEQNIVTEVAKATRGLSFSGTSEEIPEYVEKLKRALEKLEGIL